jgi:hypothetical protein
MIPQEALMDDEYPPVNQARCSNKLFEHLEHLHETNDLFGNLAKYQIQGHTLRRYGRSIRKWSLRSPFQRYDYTCEWTAPQKSILMPRYDVLIETRIQ